jgi:hypothetical protein
VDVRPRQRTALAHPCAANPEPLHARFWRALRLDGRTLWSGLTVNK